MAGTVKLNSRSATSEKPERTRRHHTRSRDGCTTCRKRHVRCDETQPVCRNCKMGSRWCEYAPAPIPLRDRRAKERNAIPGASQNVWKLDSQPGSVKESTASSRSTSSEHSMTKWGSASASESAALQRNSLVVAPPATYVKSFPAAGFDPFNTLAINMPFKSVQLMRYFYDTADAFGVMSKDPTEDCMAIIAHDSGALRNTMLLAGLHYSWNCGDSASFESTVIHHKLECVRTINSLIADCSSKSFNEAIRQVATLSMVEYCANDFQMAEAHFKGLIAVINARQAHKMRCAVVDSIDDELSDRYLILIYNFSYGFKSPMSYAEDLGALPKDAQLATQFMKRMHSFISGVDDQQSALQVAERLSKDLQHTAFDTRSPTHRPQAPQNLKESNLRNEDFRFGALRLVPHFFAPPPTYRLEKSTPQNDVNVLRYLHSLRDMTDLAERVQRATALEDKIRIYCSMWTDGAAERYYRVFVESHRYSFHARRAVPQSRSGEMISAWLGMATTAGLYLQGVLDIYNIGVPIGAPIMKHFLSTVKRDLGLMRQSLEMKNSPASDLWLWKATVAAITITRAGRVSEEFKDEISPLITFFNECLKIWSSTSGVKTWEGAQAALHRIVWPQNAIVHEIGWTLWSDALKS